MFKKIKERIKRKRETAREQQATDRLIKHIEQALGFELYEWQRLYIITGIWQPPEGRLHGRTTAYILRLLLDQSKPLLLYEFSQVAAYADNPFMGRQYQPVPMQYVGWFRHEIRSIYEQLRSSRRASKRNDNRAAAGNIVVKTWCLHGKTKEIQW